MSVEDYPIIKQLREIPSESLTKLNRGHGLGSVCREKQESPGIPYSQQQQSGKSRIKIDSNQKNEHNREPKRIEDVSLRKFKEGVFRIGKTRTFGAGLRGLVADQQDWGLQLNRFSR